ncbi:MAG TPA: hypothetical protein VK846_18725 [Candidatus Limnocylindria bacterium]|nr:hypothetical protein [Candidatus Limnocylindria bacterium]
MKVSTTERVESVAIRLAATLTFVHETHVDAIWEAFWAGKFHPKYCPTTEDVSRFTDVVDSAELAAEFQIERGFLSSTGRFLSRAQAYELAKQTRKSLTREISPLTKDINSNDLNLEASTRLRGS